MRIVRVEVAGWSRYGAVDDGHIHLFDRRESLEDLVGRTVSELVDAHRATGETVALDGLRLLAPVPHPSKIVCVGLNYRDHADEAGEQLPAEPLLFTKFPSSIIGPDEQLAWPAHLTEQVDWEAELAVVVGRELRSESSERCLRAVFGYTAANDVSARDLQFGDGQWVRGKSLDTFCPLGPHVVTADEFGDPQAKRVRALVNGVCMQDASTEDMIFPVGGLLSWISAQITLRPGDLVLTGTPPGVGAFRVPPVFLTSGDVVEVEVEGIGVLRTPVLGGR